MILIDMDGEETIRLEWSVQRGRRFRSAREKKLLSLRVLAAQADMHLTCVAKLDNGEKPSITSKELIKLCQLLEIKLDDLGYKTYADEN